MVVMNNIYQRYPKPGTSNNAAESKEDARKNISSNNSISSNNAYKQYQQNAINTATPQELTLMLYNGLVRFLKLANEGIEEKNIEKANNYIIRSQDIVIEFMCTLDMEYEVSDGMYALYDYMNMRLAEANINKDGTIVEEIISLAEQLRDTWAQAMKLAKQSAAATL